MSMEKALPGIVHTSLHLTDRVNGLYARGVRVPKAYLIAIPTINLVHKEPMIMEWEPPASCSHIWQGSLTEPPEVPRESLSVIQLLGGRDFPLESTFGRIKFTPGVGTDTGSQVSLTSDQGACPSDYRHARLADPKMT